MQSRPSFMSALREAIQLPNESLKEFSVQYKALSEQDKADLDAMLTAAGIDHDPPRSVIASS